MSEIKARRLTDIINDRPDREKILVVEVAARVANTIEALRQREHVTLAELADRVGSSTSQMSRVLSGNYTGMSLSTLVRISAGLGYRPEVIFRRAPALKSARSTVRLAAQTKPALIGMTANVSRTGRRAAS